MVVNRMREMIRRNTVRFQKNEVLFILGKFKLSAHKIRTEHLFFSVSRSKYSQNKRVAVFQVFFDLFYCKFALSEHLLMLLLRFGIPILALYLGLFINCVERFKLFLGREARVCFPFGDKLFCVNVVNIRSLALAVRTVIANLSAFGRAFVKVYFVIRKSIYKVLLRTGDFPF